MVWVSLSDYDATKANATLQVLRDNRRAYTHVALCAYNINGSQDGSFDPARSFVPIDDAQCSQCRRAMLELAAVQTPLREKEVPPVPVRGGGVPPLREH